MSDAVFGSETFDEVVDEILPLLERHWREVAYYDDIPLSPEWATYEFAARQGILRVFTVRIDDKLVGYTVFIVRPNIHYSSCVQATEDLLFVAPEYRKGRLGMQLIQYSDAELAKEGVQVVTRHVKAQPGLDFGPLLERIGYEPIDRIFGRRLDKGI